MVGEGRVNIACHSFLALGYTDHTVPLRGLINHNNVLWYVKEILLMVNDAALVLASPPPLSPIPFSSTQMEEHCARVMISIGLELSETTEQFLTDLFSFRREIRKTCTAISLQKDKMQAECSKGGSYL